MQLLLSKKKEEMQRHPNFGFFCGWKSLCFVSFIMATINLRRLSFNFYYSDPIYTTTSPKTITNYPIISSSYNNKNNIRQQQIQEYPPIISNHYNYNLQQRVNPHSAVSNDFNHLFTTTTTNSLYTPRYRSSSLSYSRPTASPTPAIASVQKTNNYWNMGGKKDYDSYQRKHHAIVIPYRNRWNHLQKFIHYMNIYLKRFPNDDFSLFVMEQANNDFFNRAFLINTGIAQVLQRFPDTHCIITHDVDLIPSDKTYDGLVPYNECPVPIQLGSELEHFNFGVPYDKSCGGIISMHSMHWKKINGMSNDYVGWGGEDDDLFLRLQYEGLLFGTPTGEYGEQRTIARPPRGHGVFYNLEGGASQSSADKNQHVHYANNVAILEKMGNPYWASQLYRRDGLNDLDYTIVKPPKSLLSSTTTSSFFFSFSSTKKNGFYEALLISVHGQIHMAKTLAPSFSPTFAPTTSFPTTLSERPKRQAGVEGYDDEPSDDNRVQEKKHDENEQQRDDGARDQDGEEEEEEDKGNDVKEDEDKGEEVQRDEDKEEEKEDDDKDEENQREESKEDNDDDKENEEKGDGDKGDKDQKDKTGKDQDTVANNEEENLDSNHHADVESQPDDKKTTTSESTSLAVISVDISSSRKDNQQGPRHSNDDDSVHYSPDEEQPDDNDKKTNNDEKQSMSASDNNRHSDSVPKRTLNSPIPKLSLQEQQKDSSTTTNNEQNQQQEEEPLPKNQFSLNDFESKYRQPNSNTGTTSSLSPPLKEFKFTIPKSNKINPRKSAFKLPKNIKIKPKKINQGMKKKKQFAMTKKSANKSPQKKTKLRGAGGKKTVNNNNKKSLGIAQPKQEALSSNNDKEEPGVIKNEAGKQEQEKVVGTQKKTVDNKKSLGAARPKQEALSSNNDNKESGVIKNEVGKQEQEKVLDAQSPSSNDHGFIKNAWSLFSS